MQKRIVIVGDAHFPWVNRSALNKTYSLIKEVKPEIVCQIGDLFDCFSFSRFPKSIDFITPKEELRQARKMAENFWNKIMAIVPNAKYYQLIGNHDSRPFKRLIERSPELASLFEINKLWDFDCVTTIKTERQELFIDGACLMHGFRSKLGDHARFNQMPTVCGHSHTGGVVFFPVRNRIIYELNVGHIADVKALPLQYGQQTLTKWTVGVGLIDKYGPRFVPL